MGRAEQRAETRNRILDAAVEAFAEQGFAASSTRDIAARAGVTQGLLTYHFTSKDELWRAAADRIFGRLGGDVPAGPPERAGTHALSVERARGAVRAFVRFGAANPELFHFMVDAGRSDDERMRWLVEAHLAGRYEAVAELAAQAFPDEGSALAPHVYYALLGAASLLFAVAPECVALTGTDPTDAAAVERHADLVARLFVPG